MWSELGAFVDVVHAAVMTAWILGLPLLFWHRWPRLSRAYGIFAVGFVVSSRLSHYLMGECFLTTLARTFWQAGPSGVEADEWFTVRFATLIFGLTPSHRAIAIGSEVLVLTTALGVLVWLHGVGKTRSSAPSLLNFS
jgi:hypothetical protein